MQLSSIEGANVTAEGTHFWFCDNAALRGPSRQPRVCFEERVWSLKRFFLSFFISALNANAGEVQSRGRVLVAIFLFCFRVLAVCVWVCVLVRDANEGKST